VSQILKSKRIFVLKEEAGTLPRFFYYFDERRPRSGENVPDAPAPVGRVEPGDEA
jgi:hypothetical protein